MYSRPSYGIDQFSEPLCVVDLDTSVIELFYARREDILNQLKENSWRLEKPYGFNKDPSDNLIYQIIYRSDLWHFSEEALNAFPIWNTRSVKVSSNPDWVAMPEDREIFALIDCALYLVYLLNVYEPNKLTIHNIVSTRCQVDALGRKNYKPVIAEIRRLITRVTATERAVPERQAEHMLLFVNYDIANSHIVVRDNEGIDFERRCAALLSDAGVSVRMTNVTGDFGADIIAEIDGLNFAIQCKDTARPVGVKGVQEVVGARAHYKSDYGVVCATGGFTDAAIELAFSNKVLLCSAEQLVQRLRTI